MVDLETLKADIEHVGNQIRDAKKSLQQQQGGTTTTTDANDDIPTLIAKLNGLKKEYADHNDGIGVDGKPFQAAPLSKAEKKKMEKEQKKTNPAAESGSGGNNNPGKQASNPENAAKKAAKKEQAKQAKAAGGAGGGGGGGGNNNKAPPAATKNNPAGSAVGRTADHPASSSSSSSSSYQVNPLQMVFNPNHPLDQRPVVALTMAILTNTDVELQLTSDHRASQSLLGLPSSTDDNAAGTTSTNTSIVGDLAMARYLQQRSSSSSNKSSLTQQAISNQWLDYASAVSKLPKVQRIKGVCMTLEHALGHTTKTYLVEPSALSLADVALFGALGFPSQAGDLHPLQDYMHKEGFVAAHRWVTMMAQSSAIQRATQLALGVNGTEEVVTDASASLEPLVSGMNLLEGAIPGHVVTRFPPEPSGYLHVGHAKAVLLNDYYARRYKGRLIVRFDDTNPSKEKEEYQQSIVEDLKLLGVYPDVVTYTSDYFAVIHGYALQLIEKGLAYMDDTPQEVMKEERANRIESKHRNQSPQAAQELFVAMCNGTPEGAKYCLRAKIDMASDNGTLRDPVLFRQNLTPHHRSGTTYKAYPTYDLACPIVDSLEGVTHALRTTEYNDRDEQYQWILQALGLRKVRIHAFSRVNFMYTVLSKRKLAWFVEQGLVEGWGDARFPTVRGVVRRGVNVSALRTFIYGQGASRRVVNMEWNKFWAENKREIDRTAKRFMAVDANDNVELAVTNHDDDDGGGGAVSHYLTTSFHPKDPALGERAIRIGSKVLLERADTDGMVVGEDIVLLRWGVVRLTKVIQTDGKITSLAGEFIPDGDFKAAKRKLSWLANTPLSNPKVVLTEFDYLVTKEKLEEDDNFADFVNPNTVATTTVLGDAGLKMLRESDVIQLERRGYYRVDRPYIGDDKPLVLYMIPDGKSKAMSGQSGKLAHH